MEGNIPGVKMNGSVDGKNRYDKIRLAKEDLATIYHNTTTSSVNREKASFL